MTDQDLELVVAAVKWIQENVFVGPGTTTQEDDEIELYAVRAFIAGAKYAIDHS